MCEDTSSLDHSVTAAALQTNTSDHDMMRKTPAIWPKAKVNLAPFSPEESESVHFWFHLLRKLLRMWLQRRIWKGRCIILCLKTLKIQVHAFNRSTPYDSVCVCWSLRLLRQQHSLRQIDVLSTPAVLRPMETQPMWMLLFKGELLLAVRQGGGRAGGGGVNSPLGSINLHLDG